MIDKIKYCIYSFIICGMAFFNAITMVIFTNHYPVVVDLIPKKIRKSRKLDKEKAYSHFNRLFER